MDFLWFLGGFEVSFGSQNQYKTSSISGSIFGADSENPQSKNPSKISSAKNWPLKNRALAYTRARFPSSNPCHYNMLCFFRGPVLGSLFWWKTCLFRRCFLNNVMDCFFTDFSCFWDAFWELFWSIFDIFLKTRFLWKIASRRDESTIFKVLEGLETLLFCYFFGYGFRRASGMDFWWFLGGFGVRFGSQNP